MNLKLLIAILLLVAALGIGAAVVFLFVLPKPASQEPAQNQPATFPTGSDVSGVSGGEITIPGAASTTMTVADFVHNGETVPDTVNPGKYVLAGSLGYCLADGSCPAGADEEDFSVSYNAKSGVFTIALLKESIKDSRAEAEQFLMKRLGIAPEQMCSLNYFVGTPYFVNERFSSGNLGFSFCPGSVKLP